MNRKDHRIAQKLSRPSAVLYAIWQPAPVTVSKSPSERSVRHLTVILFVVHSLWPAILMSLGDTIQTETNFSNSVNAQASYRRMWQHDQRYPVLELYVPNQTSEQVVWSKVRLDGAEVASNTNGVLWTQWYPSDRALAGQTVLLQINLALPLAGTNQVIEVETSKGRKLKLVTSPDAVPGARITGVSFTERFDAAFLTYQVGQPEMAATSSSESRAGATVTNGRPVLTISKAWVNGMSCGRNVRMVQMADDKTPGILRVQFPEPLAQGKPVHIRLESPNGETAQTIVRAHWGTSLDSWGVKEDDEALRRELGLDVRPRLRHIPDWSDPTCLDGEHKQPGASAPHILPVRKKWYEEGDDRLSYLYLCTTSKGHVGYSIYGQMADATFVNPYCLRSSAKRKVIEDEEQYFQYVLTAAQPRPWGWIPETFTTRQRILEAEEFRLQAYAALGMGAKGIMYWTYDKEFGGYAKSPRLLAEIKKINREIKQLEPLLGSALPLHSETQDVNGNWVRVSTLWSGEQNSLVVLVRNQDYKTDREPNDWGNKPRFKINPKKDIRVRVHKPETFSVDSAIEVLTKQSIPCRVESGQIVLDVGDLELGKIIQVMGK